MNEIYLPPKLTAQELAVVDEIEQLKVALGHVVTSTRRWNGLLRRSTFARAIAGSNTIEGYEVSPDDAIAAVEGDEPLDAKEEAWRAVNCYRTAMTYVLQLADAPNFRYSLDLLFGLHFMMLEYDLSKRPGRFRPGAIRVHDHEKHEDVHEGPPADQLADLMIALMRSMNSPGRDTPRLVQAAMAHLNLAMLHPFTDGNGRMARCLHTLVLARTGILAPVFSSIEEWLGRNTRPYYDVLLQVGGGGWHPESDTRPWIKFCLIAHYQQAKTLHRRIQELESLWNLLEEETRKRGLPERVMLALSDAASGLRIRNAMYRSVADISKQVATRDLALLVKEGLLIPSGERRGRLYARSPILAAMREKVRLSKKIPDPFAREERLAVEPYLPGFGPD